LKTLHIISFDVPYPANYGGVIDVFYKLRYLYDAGVNIILHCFEYGRGEQVTLNRFCQKVYYYKRSKSLHHHFSKKPFIVKTRISEELINNLLKDEGAILFEGLHTCGILNDTRLKNRFKIYRESNIEHEYYEQLSSSEKSILKKVYLKIESKKLARFEHILSYSDFMLTVSKSDTEYLKYKFPNHNIEYLPSFHPYKNSESIAGKGNYVLYHGNLQISENHVAAMYLVKYVFINKNLSYKIAGLNPLDELKNAVSEKKNIELIENPDDARLKVLIQQAHINCLITFHESGLKLKLLHALFAGRFCLVNNNMLFGTDLAELCIVANEPEEMINAINNTFTQTFELAHINERKAKMIGFDVMNNAYRIKEIIS
jgi:hypothetical protein